MDDEGDKPRTICVLNAFQVLVVNEETKHERQRCCVHFKRGVLRVYLRCCVHDLFEDRKH